MTDPRNPAIFPIIAMATDGERQNHVVRREWICPKSQWSGKYSPLADSSSTKLVAQQSAMVMCNLQL